MTRRHLAVDLGASGGRVALGTIEGGRLTVEILHRWSHEPVPYEGRLYWDREAIKGEVLEGLKRAGGDVVSVGVNSWGVDYQFVGAKHDWDESPYRSLVDGMHHYRSPHTVGEMERVVGEMGRETIYGETGIQFMSINTIYQLSTVVGQGNPAVLRDAEWMLMVPDYFHYWLSGERSNERTIASTSQLYDPSTGDWSDALIGAIGVPRALFGPISDPGTVLGPVMPWLQESVGLTGTKVVLPASHDTASAVAAVPAQGDDWAYVSSGTWSLVGVETPRPFIDARTLASNLTNEAGVNGTTRLLKNVMGLWILQECRRAWGNVSFNDLYREAESYESPDVPTFDPDAAEFMAPGLDMPERVWRAMRRSTIDAPERGLVVRSILESLAEKTAEIITTLQQVTDRTIRTVHIVGGGSQIDFLNRLIAQRTGRKVVAGPVEATLMGNLLVQAEAMGSIPRGSIRDVVRAGTVLKTYLP